MVFKNNNNTRLGMGTSQATKRRGDNPANWLKKIDK